MTADISTREGLFAVMRQLADEREAAKPLVAELLARDEIPWDEDVPEEWRTAGFVQELTKAAAGMVERDPTKCLSLLQFATTIARSASARDYVRLVIDEIESRLWNEIGWTQRYLTDFREADRSLTVALGKAQQHGALTHDAAVVKYTMAGVCLRRSDFERATELLDEAEEAFKYLGDKRRLLRCLVFKANVAHGRGNNELAYEQLLRVVEEVQAIDDEHTNGVVFSILGTVLTRLGRMAEARMNLERALRIFTAANMTIEIDRVKWLLAIIRLQESDFRGALAELRSLRTAFLAREMIDEAGLVGLDIADALIAIGEIDEARQLVKTVVAEFEQTDVNVSMSTALAYLRELSPNHRNPRAAVQHVRRFIERSREIEPDAFVPLNEENDEPKPRE